MRRSLKRRAIRMSLMPLTSVPPPPPSPHSDPNRPGASNVTVIIKVHPHPTLVAQGTPQATPLCGPITGATPLLLETTYPIDTIGLSIGEANQAKCQWADALGPAANTHYGGRRVLGRNITMPNGNMDPWHSLSVINASDAFYDAGSGAAAVQRTAGVTVVELHDTSHCRDMFAPGAFATLKPPRGPIEDTPSVLFAHEVIGADVARYVGQKA